MKYLVIASVWLAGCAAVPPQTISPAVTLEKLSVPAQRFVAAPAASPATQQAFPRGFPLSFGSGLAFKGREADGALSFWALTDRGPNGDSPDRDTPNGPVKTKVFPVPDFQPQYGIMTLRQGGAEFRQWTGLVLPDGRKASGLPPAGGELALPDDLQTPLPFDPQGVDPEGIAPAADGRVWIAEEYGPSLLQVDAASGQILRRYQPGAGLPEIFAYRLPNRGFESLTLAPNGRVYALLQSILDLPKLGDKTAKQSAIIRLLELDPATGATRQFAYPHDGAVYKKARDAKIGDLVAVGPGRFVVIEQGTAADGRPHHRLYRLDLAGASDISALTGADAPEYQGSAWNKNGLVGVSKTLLLDLDALGWQPEKAEGLALVDEHTLVLANDNDFGLSAEVRDARQQLQSLEACRLTSAGELVAGEKDCRGGAPRAYRLVPGTAHSSVWVLHFNQSLLAD